MPSDRKRGISCGRTLIFLWRHFLQPVEGLPQYTMSAVAHASTYSSAWQVNQEMCVGLTLLQGMVVVKRWLGSYCHVQKLQGTAHVHVQGKVYVYVFRRYPTI